MLYMQTPSTLCTQGTLVLALLGLLASSAWGYRPFVSTDAAVVDSREVEIELGYFTLERTQGENTFTIPSLVLNYGLLTNVELVGELRVQQNPTQTIDVVDPGLFVKAVLKEGILQGKDGISVAIEAGPLLPSTVPGERRFGFEGIGILSGRLPPFTYHVNLGGGVQRAGGEPVAIWGVIGLNIAKIRYWPVKPFFFTPAHSVDQTADLFSPRPTRYAAVSVRRHSGPLSLACRPHANGCKRP